MLSAPLPSCASFLCKPAQGCRPPRHQGIHGPPPGSSGLCRQLFPVYTCTYLECAFGKFPGFFRPVFFVLCPFRGGMLGKRFIAIAGDDGEPGAHRRQHPSEPTLSEQDRLLLLT